MYVCVCLLLHGFMPRPNRTSRLERERECVCVHTFAFDYICISMFARAQGARLKYVCVRVYVCAFFRIWLCCYLHDRTCRMLQDYKMCIYSENGRSPNTYIPTHIHTYENTQSYLVASHHCICSEY
jgi:hypothetical protein